MLTTVFSGQNFIVLCLLCNREVDYSLNMCFFRKFLKPIGSFPGKKHWCLGWCELPVVTLFLDKRSETIMMCIGVLIPMFLPASVSVGTDTVSQNKTIVYDSAPCVGKMVFWCLTFKQYSGRREFFWLVCISQLRLAQISVVGIVISRYSLRRV